MKRYKVTVQYGGTAEAVVYAENEEDAKCEGRCQALENINIDSANTNIRSTEVEELGASLE